MQATKSRLSVQRERAATEADLGPEPLQKPVQQHLLMQNLKQGVVQEQPFPSSALNKLVNDDGDDQVQHDEVDPKYEGDAVNG